MSTALDHFENYLSRRNFKSKLFHGLAIDLVNIRHSVCHVFFAQRCDIIIIRKLDQALLVMSDPLH